MSKRNLFVVSDIHGHFTLFKEALHKAGFDKENPNHLLVCCGDYFDRGEENVEVLKYFEQLKHKILLRGNHEDLLLNLFQTGKLEKHNYINGTMSTLKNFFGKYSIDPLDDSIDFSGKNRTVDRLCEFMNETLDYYETENYVFVHGWLPGNCVTSESLKDVTEDAWKEARKTRWTAKYNGERLLQDKILICGHMPTFYADKFDSTRSKNDSSVFYGNGIIAIDAGTYETKQVNVLVLEEECDIV